MRGGKRSTILIQNDASDDRPAGRSTRPTVAGLGRRNRRPATPSVQTDLVLMRRAGIRCPTTSRLADNTRCACASRRPGAASRRRSRITARLYAQVSLAGRRRLCRSLA